MIRGFSSLNVAQIILIVMLSAVGLDVYADDFANPNLEVHHWIQIPFLNTGFREVMSHRSGILSVMLGNAPYLRGAKSDPPEAPIITESSLHLAAPEYYRDLNFLRGEAKAGTLAEDAPYSGGVTINFSHRSQANAKGVVHNFLIFEISGLVSQTSAELSIRGRPGSMIHVIHWESAQGLRVMDETLAQRVFTKIYGEDILRNLDVLYQRTTCTSTEDESPEEILAPYFLDASAIAAFSPRLESSAEVKSVKPQAGVDSQVVQGTDEERNLALESLPGSSNEKSCGESLGQAGILRRILRYFGL